MIAEGLAVLLDYILYLLPGVTLFGLWFALTPQTQTALRIMILLFTLIEGSACWLVRMRYGGASTVTHGTAIWLIAVPMAGHF